MSEFIKIAWRNLWRNKRRTLVITFAIALGVWGVLVAIAVDNAFVYQMMDNFIYTHLGHIEIHANGYQKNPSLRLCMPEAEALLEKVRGTRHIKGYAPRIKAFGLAQSPRASQGVMIIGIDPELEANVTRIRTFITEGRYFNKDDFRSVLIGESLSHKLKADVGDKVTFFTQGFRSEEGVIESLRVIGLYRSGISEFDKALVYIPLKLGESILEMDGKLSEVAIVVDDEKNLDLVKDTLKEKVMGKDTGLKFVKAEVQDQDGGGINLIKVMSDRQGETIHDPEALGESFRLNRGTAAVAYRLVLPSLAENLVPEGNDSEVELDLIGIDPVNENKVTTVFDRVEVSENGWLAGSEIEKELDVRDDWIILGEQTSLALSAGAGDTVRLEYEDESLEMEVAGILKGGIEEGDDAPFALMSRRQMWGAFSRDPSVSEVLIRLEPGSDPEAVSQELIAGLGREVLYWGELYPILEQMAVLMDIANYVFLLCVYIAVAFGIANTMIMSVFERVRELGILKAVGTRPGQLFNMVILESVMLAMIGMGLGGVVSGVTVWVWARNGLDLSMFAEGMEAMGLGTVLYPVLTFENIIFSVVGAFIIAVLSALYPALRASRLPVVEALQRI